MNTPQDLPHNLQQAFQAVMAARLDPNEIYAECNSSSKFTSLRSLLRMMVARLGSQALPVVNTFFAEMSMLEVQELHVSLRAYQLAPEMNVLLHIFDSEIWHSSIILSHPKYPALGIELWFSGKNVVVADIKTDAHYLYADANPVNMDMGTVKLQTAKAVFDKLYNQWGVGKKIQYHVLKRNCNHFAALFVAEQMGGEVEQMPIEINRIARVTSTLTDRLELVVESMSCIVQITQDLLPNRNVKKAVAEVSELLESEIEQQAEQQKQKHEEQQKQQHEEQQKQQQEEQQTDEPQLVRLVKPLRIQPIRISARNRHILSSGHLPAMAVPITDCNCKASHIILLSDEDVTDPMDAYTEQILSNVFLQLDAEAAELLIARLKLSKEAEEASDSEVEPQPDWLISPISQRSARDEGLARF
jgi:hypothetical protein